MMDLTGAAEKRRHRTEKRWKVSAFDREIFEEVMMEATPIRATSEELAQSVMDCVIGACDAAMPRKSGNPYQHPVYW